MATYRSDMLNNSNLSTNRLLSENDNLTAKYNQYKRNLIGSPGMSTTMKSDFQFNNSTTQINKNYDSSSNYFLSNILPDNDNDIKYTQLKKLYDDRIRSLYGELKQAIRKLESDEILGTMKTDTVLNNEFATQRIKEIVDEHLINEKEEIISRLNEENADLRGKLAYMGSNSEYVNKLKIINEENEAKIKHMESVLNETYQKNQHLQSDVTALRTQLQSLHSGHELDYKKLHDEYMLTLTKQTNELQKLKSENGNYIDQANYYENKLKEISQEYEENKLEMDRLQKVISVLEIDLNSSESKLKEKQTRIEALQHELTNLQTQFFEINLKYKKFHDENKSLQSIIDHYEKERKDMLDKYSSFNDDLQRSHNERLENQEKKNKEKYNTLKKKIVELKGVISNLEEEIKQEKNNSMNIKINYSKVYTTMQEDMKLIKTEWEKKLKEEQLQFDKILSELENKHALEINNLKHDHQIELENKNRDLMKYKQNSDLLKNFEKEFIRITNHEEILNQNNAEMKKKFEKELQLKEEELECEYKRKVIKIDEEKKGEYEFLTENIRKNLKNLEKTNEELKENCQELQNKLSFEKENNENLNTTISNLQKTVRTLNSEVEEKENYLRSLSDKTYNYEETLKSFSQTNKNFKNNMDNLLAQISDLEKENRNLINEIKEKEENHKEEMAKFEKTFNNYKEKETEKFDKEHEAHLKIKNKLTEYEEIIDNLQNDNNYFSNKCSELEDNLQSLDTAYENLSQKLKITEDELTEKEKKIFELNKLVKTYSFEKSNTSELITKILKTKLTSIRSEISSIKSYYNNEISQIKKDYAKIIETLFTKIKIFTMGFEKELELNTRKNKENIEKEFKVKLDEKDNELQAEIKKVEQKFEKHLLEQFRISEKLEKENKNLIDQQQGNLLKCKEHTYKLQEFEQEVKNLNNQIGKLKVENDVLNETIEKLRLEKLNFNKIKMETEETGENVKRETIRRLQTNLSNVLLVLAKMKKKYNQDILNMKLEIEELNKNYEVELNNAAKFYKSSIENLEHQLREERDNHKKIRNDVENKENEFNSIQRDLEKLKDIYENKIKLLSNKINSDEDTLKDMKIELKRKNEQMKELSNYLQEYKSQLKSLKTQVELKSDEVYNTKKEYEKLLTLKDKKIHDLQSIVNQSLYSYNSGLNNIKIANKLDDEVKVLMKRAKIDENDSSMKK